MGLHARPGGSADLYRSILFCLRQRGHPARNFWSTFDAQEANRHNHSVFEWQKAHVGEVQNEHADQLAGAAYHDDVTKTIGLRTKHGGIIARAKKYVQLMAEMLQRDAQAVKDDEVHFDESGPPNGGYLYPSR